MPKKQPTASKKARAAQRASGGKHTTLLLDAQTCGKQLDPWDGFPETCTRPAHDDTEPCSLNPNFDVDAWKTKEAAEHTAAQARWSALTPEQRAEEERRIFEDEHDDGRTATDDYEDARSWKWED
ncbi:hypothetical protein [Streptomyces sp. ME19-01-6]|uniref:hypothetical protein n=1 Tax=Streptomyces sp. ME19-01-6 TaxID=3028686 RepID=UPI0029B2C398|nr:hypothetical protein [Streptomyces sp. ME19-01-6]MDX3232911.1 hypothetical protein [Streptomyces sp. ME19-01-6]